MIVYQSAPKIGHILSFQGPSVLGIQAPWPWVFVKWSRFPKNWWVGCSLKRMVQQVGRSHAQTILWEFFQDPKKSDSKKKHTPTHTNDNEAKLLHLVCISLSAWCGVWDMDRYVTWESFGGRNKGLFSVIATQSAKCRWRTKTDHLFFSRRVDILSELFNSSAPLKGYKRDPKGD